MALHGNVRVNGRLLGVWSAVRGITVVEQPTTYEYRCEAMWVDEVRGAHTKIVFTVDHAFDDGATALAARVLAAAAQRAPADPGGGG